MAITPVGDQTITRQVQGKLASRGLGPPCRIIVLTSKGQVTLSGTVQQDAQKNSAAQVARNIGGVKNVVNQLTIKARDKF
jgi:hyperosmotically inducible periplasmic protein